MTETTKPVNFPALNDLHAKNSLDRMLNIAFTPYGLRTPSEAQLATTFVRLVDKTVWEYEAAREHVVRRFTANDNSVFLAAVRGISHLETCIDSLHRAIRYAKALARRGLQLPSGEPLIPRANALRVLSDHVEGRVGDIRNAVHHYDEEITGVGVPIGTPIAVRPTENGVELAGVSITYEELSQWIRRLHELAERVNQVDQSSLTSPIGAGGRPVGP